MKASETLAPVEVLQLANFLMELRGSVEIEVHYRNYRGETRSRRLIPRMFWHGATKWHPERCLLLRAFDVEKNADRDFRVIDFYPGTMNVVVGGAS